MSKLIIYDPPLSKEDIDKLRSIENLSRAPEIRIKIMFELMQLSARFKYGPLKKPNEHGLVLKSKYYDNV